MYGENSEWLSEYHNRKAWAINAKNSLQMVSGFSPYQIVFGQQPNLPSVLTDKLPALAGTTSNKVLSDHINAMHLSCQAFMHAESSERFRRALCNKICAITASFDQGDKVYFKWDRGNKWKGPAIVIGQDGKMIFVRHGSIYFRISANRIIKSDSISFNNI